MNHIGSILIFGIIAVLFIAAVIYLRRNGHCSACGGGCEGCSCDCSSRKNK
ncbi:MAG: hypothetical protein J6S21_03140 [Victivallales bacterium]|nr:hypothetical protein [Victivallales bacterium]